MPELIEPFTVLHPERTNENPLMKSAVCTLFEGHYHFGVAALINSLLAKGFRGSFYAGFKGALPPWAGSASDDATLNWAGAKTLKISQDCLVHFLPVTTDYHLTNFKPDFMIRVCEGPAQWADSIAYFDPDIVIKCRWSFFESWMRHGIALVHEIVDNDMPPTHPMRREWETIIYKTGRKTLRKINSYINGGFCGLMREDIQFLYNWKYYITHGIKEYNALLGKISGSDKSVPFNFLDQDAMNIAVMCTDAKFSEMGPSGMDFIHGGWTMSHAVGSPKPWKKKYLFEFFKGIGPSLADRAYWRFADGPVKCYTGIYLKYKEFSLLLAGFLSRFYQRN